MSDYIIHNIGLTVSSQLKLFSDEEPDKPVGKFPNYYIGKAIGSIGNELKLFRTRQNNGKEFVPNCVLRNEDGIALIRIHNKEDVKIVNLPEDTKSDKNCNVESKSSYPFGYVVVDYRDGKCQLAIEKTSEWDSKTVTMKCCLENFFNEQLEESLGITTNITEKTIKKDFEKFIDQRTIDHGDVIESFTFQYVNVKRNPTTRIPDSMSEQMDMYSQMLEIYGAISGVTTMNMGEAANKEKLKQLSTVVTYSTDNAFDLVVKLRDYGEYSCSEGTVAKYPMNDVVISNYKDFVNPYNDTSDFNLKTWLDEAFEKVKKGKDDEEIPTKPME